MHKIDIQKRIYSNKLYVHCMDTNHHGWWSINHCLSPPPIPPDPRIQIIHSHFVINTSKNLRCHYKNGIWQLSEDTKRQSASEFGSIPFWWGTIVKLAAPWSFFINHVDITITIPHCHYVLDQCLVGGTS